MSNFGTLQRVDLRDGWIDEARDFTPWLAECDNLRMLGDTIGLQLECEAVEKPVGPFSADILCRDTATGSWVLIENQLERTDHTHLGQVITYAAGLKAATIVWVARQFREDATEPRCPGDIGRRAIAFSRAAIDWLNEISSEEYSFFGIEIELWQIADSPKAPKFNVVCKPNDWSREVRESAREVGELSDVRQMQLQFWQKFVAYLAEKQSPIKPQSPKARHGILIPIGMSGVNLSAVMTMWDSETGKQNGEIRAQLYMHGFDAPDLFESLLQQRDDIERGVGTQLTWKAEENVRRRRIYLRKQVPVEDRNRWLEYFKWLEEQLVRFDQTFRSLLSQIGRTNA